MLSRSLSRTSALARATPAFAHYPVRGSSRELRDRTSFSLPRASALARKAPNFAALAVCGANFFCSSTEVQDRISQVPRTALPLLTSLAVGEAGQTCFIYERSP